MITKTRLEIGNCKSYCKEDKDPHYWTSGCPLFLRMHSKLGQYHGRGGPDVNEENRLGGKLCFTYSVKKGRDEQVGEGEQEGMVTVEMERTDSEETAVSQCVIKIKIDMPEDSALHEDIPMKLAESYRELRASERSSD